MPDQERFNGLTLEELESATNQTSEIGKAIVAVCTAYKRVQHERDTCRAQLELLRKAAGGK